MTQPISHELSDAASTILNFEDTLSDELSAIFAEGIVLVQSRTDSSDEKSIKPQVFHQQLVEEAAELKDFSSNLSVQKQYTKREAEKATQFTRLLHQVKTGVTTPITIFPNEWKDKVKTVAFGKTKYVIVYPKSAYYTQAMDYANILIDMTFDRISAHAQLQDFPIDRKATKDKMTEEARAIAIHVANAGWRQKYTMLAITLLRLLAYVEKYDAILKSYLVKVTLQQSEVTGGAFIPIASTKVTTDHRLSNGVTTAAVGAVSRVTYGLRSNQILLLRDMIFSKDSALRAKAKIDLSATLTVSVRAEVFRNPGQVLESAIYEASLEREEAVSYLLKSSTEKDIGCASCSCIYFITNNQITHAECDLMQWLQHILHLKHDKFNQYSIPSYCYAQPAVNEYIKDIMIKDSVRTIDPLISERESDFSLYLRGKPGLPIKVANLGAKEVRMKDHTPSGNVSSIPHYQTRSMYKPR